MRHKAMDWWNALSFNYKQESMPFSGRSPSTLTGREIEHLYCIEMKKQFANMVLNYLTLNVADSTKILSMMRFAEEKGLGNIGTYPNWEFTKI